MHMAWIEKKKRSDGGVSARVVWRLGGSRDGAYQSETFSAGTDAMNMERARGFKSMVEPAGQRWPEGWVRGEGFVRPNGVDPMRRPPRFDEIGEEYVRQIVDLSPGQRKRYLGQLRVLAATRVQGELVFTKPVTSITEADLRAWLLTWDRSMKTKSNYHGLIHGVCADAIAKGWLSVNPTVRTALKGSRVRQSRPELRFLTEAECEAAVKLAGPYGDLITVAVGTGLRFGEITALWVSDVDLTRRAIRVSKAWKFEVQDADPPPLQSVGIERVDEECLRRYRDRVVRILAGGDVHQDRQVPDGACHRTHLVYGRRPGNDPRSRRQAVRRTQPVDVVQTREEADGSAGVGPESGDAEVRPDGDGRAAARPARLERGVVQHPGLSADG